MQPLPPPQTLAKQIALQIVPAVVIAVSVIWINSVFTTTMSNMWNRNMPWACYKRDRAYNQLHQALHAARAHAGASSSGSRIRTRPNLPLQFEHFDAVRTAARRVRAVARLCTRNADPPKYAAYEWSVTARYSTDGVLTLLSAVLGSENGTLVSVDSGNEYSGAEAVLAPAIALDMRPVEVRLTKEAREHAQTRIGETNVHSSIRDAARNLRSIDLLALFLDDGNEADAISRFSYPPVLVAQYRDFLGPELALKRVQTPREKAVPILLDADGVDSGRPLPQAGYSLRGLATLASIHSYRLVWCLEHAPVAFFVRRSHPVADRLFPTVSVNECWRARANDPRFLDRMADLWHQAEGHRWKRMQGLWFWTL